MESWSNVSEGKRFRFDEINSPANSLARNKVSFSNWESQNSYSSGRSSTNIDNQAQQHIDNDLASSSKVMPAFPGEDDLISSKMSGSIGDSSSWDSSLICLNLGRFSGHKTTPPPPIWSSSDSSSKPPSKRVRGSGLNTQAYFCQVYGCNKDLCSSKDYHKRHKVCEMHSKTARVIVNGFEQRFCQQCSRFHLLAEFDDGKRSCRKRLAGHNERRRKPLLGTGSGKSLHPYDNISFPSTKVLASTSFICQDILLSPPFLLHTNKFPTNDWSSQIKVEQDSNKSTLGPPLHCNVGMQVPGYLDKVTNTGQYALNSNSSADYMFNEASIGSEGLSFFDTSCVPVSGCALSLLSSHHRSQNSSTHSSKIGIGLPKLVMPDIGHSQTNYGLASSGSSDVINFETKDQISHETSPTIDLLQLSSQLERVEHQKQSGTVRWVPQSS